MELYTVSTSATRAYAWTMAHTAVSGGGFRVWVRVVRATLYPGDVLPSQTREDVPRRLLYHSHAARHRFGRRVARRAVRVPSDGRAETTSTQK